MYVYTDNVGLYSACTSSKSSGRFCQNGFSRVPVGRADTHYMYGSARFFLPFSKWVHVQVVPKDPQSKPLRLDFVSSFFMYCTYILSIPPLPHPLFPFFFFSNHLVASGVLHMFFFSTFPKCILQLVSSLDLVISILAGPEI